MNTLGAFYKQTWWLWLLFAILLGALAHFVSLVFLLGIPVLAAYSFYFGAMRVGEIREEERKKRQNAA